MKRFEHRIVLTPLIRTNINTAPRAAENQQNAAIPAHTLQARRPTAIALLRDSMSPIFLRLVRNAWQTCKGISRVEH